MRTCDVKAGQLRTPVAIMRLDKISGDRGGWTEKQVERATVMARIKPGSGRRTDRGDFDQAVSDLEAVIRYRSDIDRSDRFDIVGISYRLAGPPENVEMKNRWLRLKLSEVPA